MADDTSNLTDPTDFSQIGELFTNGVLQKLAASSLPKALLSEWLQAKGAEFAIAWKLFLDGITFVATKYEEGEQAVAPIAGRAVAPILSGLFGGNGSAGDFSQRMGQGGGDAVARSIVDGLIGKITAGQSGPVEPSIEGASRIASAAVAASIESSINALIPELVSDFLPFDLGKISALTELPEGVLRSLGIGRLVRQALRPVVDATCTTPATWYYKKQFRDHLLGAAEVARQVARARWTDDQAKEELARDGYSDDRIEAILNSVAKFLSAADLYWLVRAQQWSLEEAQQHLQDSGYTDLLAPDLLTIEKIKLIAQFDDALALAAVDAFAAGRIDEGTLGAYVHGTTFTDQQIAQHTELAHAKKVLNAKPLTGAEAEAGVLAGVLAYVDYRDALALENRTEDAITALELMLRAKVDSKTAIADHKAQQAADVAAAKKAKLDAAAAKKQAQEQKLALAERGKPAQLEQAYLAGLIPIERVQEVWSPLYDADTVATLSADLEAKRAAIVAKQDAAAKAKARAAQRHIDIAQMEKAVKDGVLTLSQYGDQLTGLGFDPGDVQTLTSTLSDDIAKATAAKQLHDQVAAAAKTKHVDLATLELLVRKGHESISTFNDTIKGLGYDAAAIATLDDKLQLEIDADAKAAQVKAAAAAKAADKGLSLAEAERATVLGVQTLDWFNTWLLHAGIDVTAQPTIMATVTDERQQAEAAQQRRAAADARRDASGVSVADLAKAARLGVLPIDAYAAALTARGYAPDAVTLDTDLLTTEIANAQAALQKKAGATTVAKQKHVNLAELDAAVKAGTLSIPAYTQRVIDLGFSADDAALIASVVADQAAAAKLVASRKAAATTTLAAKHLSLGQLETGVLDGLLTLDAFEQRLIDLGFSAADVGLLGGELAQRQATLATATARKAQLATTDPGKETSRAAFEKAVTDGVKTMDDYQAFLVEQGYGDDDVQLYLALEQFTLDKAAAKAAPVP